MKETPVFTMDMRLDYFMSKHYEFLHQLGFLLCLSAMLIILYLTVNGMDLNL
jgi:hypothetical protein